jgi:ABC-type Na+ efflux pump permease subunit
VLLNATERITVPEINLGKWLVVAGVVLVLIGLAVMLGGKIGLGRLPGDIRYKSDNVTLYVPIATSILLSIVLTLILWIIGRMSK